MKMCLQEGCPEVHSSVPVRKRELRLIVTRYIRIRSTHHNLMNTAVFNCMDTHVGNGLLYFNVLLQCPVLFL